jgi:translation initiation factor RLI1
MDQEVQHLSGGELQRVAITMALGMPADIYLIDEPSAYLDSEQRIVAAKVSTFWFVQGAVAHSSLQKVYVAGMFHLVIWAVLSA